MSEKDDNRLGRWSRLKRKRARGEDVAEPEVSGKETAVADDAGGGSRRGAAAPVAGKPYLPPLADPDLPVPENAALSTRGADGDHPAESADNNADEEDVRELTEEEAAYVETLPPVEDLTADSDFAAFLDKRVPEFIRRRALRKLWLSDPAFGFLDGMNDYDEDFSVITQLAAGATAYRPDQGGYAWRDKPKEAEEAEEAEEGDAAGDGAEATQSDADAGQSVEATHEESMADKAQRVQNAGGRDVRARTYTANPYYQAPGMRSPVSDRQPGAGADDGHSDDDDLGDAEDDFA